MALTRMALSATTSLLLTSLVLFNVVMTSTLPSAHPLPDVHTARTNNNNGAKLAPETTDLGSVVDCPRGYYYSGVSMVCTRCSKCPVNQIIRQPCSARADTKCGPFFEFNQFLQSPVEKKTSADSSAQDSQDTEQSATSGSKEEEDIKEEADQRTVLLERATGQWRTLSFALIAVLSFICCIVVAVGLYVCVTLRRSQTHKFVFRQPELMAPQSVDPEPRYVDMYATSLLRHNSRPAGHLPVYQQIFTGYDLTEALPSTPLTGGDVKKEVVNRADEGDYVSVYVNTAALEPRDS